MTRCFLFFTLLFISVVAIAQPSNARWEYIQRYKEIAVTEMQRAGVPASIKLAQGLLESGAGSSSLAKEAKNHFGMKCGADWRGEKYYLEDDDFNESGELIQSCFRVFNSTEESFRAHSEFLRDPNKAYRYGFLFRLDPLDYKKWATGLKQSGYATSPTYDAALISIIEQYELFRYDVGGGNPSLVDISYINDVKVIIAMAGQTPEQLAQKYNISVRKLMKYNEGLATVKQELKQNERVFLQRKRLFYRKNQKVHFVNGNETMYEISQKYGVRLKNLYRKNGMKNEEQPAVKEKIIIRKTFADWFRKRKSPKLRDASFEQENGVPTDDGRGEKPEVGKDETNPEDFKSNTNQDNNSNSNSNNNNTSNTSKDETRNPSNQPSKETKVENGTKTNSGKTETSTGVKENTNNTTKNNTPTNETKNNTKNNTSTTTGTKTNANNNTGGSTTKPTTNTGNTGTKIGTTSSGTLPNKPQKEVVKEVVKEDTKKPTDTSSRPTGVQYHTIEKGETLYSIAKRYGMTVDGLMKLNDLTDNNVKIGQKLRLN